MEYERKNLQNLVKVVYLLNIDHIGGIWRLAQNLNIYKCCRIHREANRTTDCLAKEVICITDLNIWLSDFPRDVGKFSFEDY